jgi:hypothetical protein
MIKISYLVSFGTYSKYKPNKLKKKKREDILVYKMTKLLKK